MGRGVHFGAGVHIGVHLTHGLPQVGLIHCVVPLEHRHRLVPRNGHDAEIVNTGSSSIRAGLTNTHGQRTYLVAVLSVLVNVWLIGITRPSSALVSLDLKRIVPV